MSDAVRSRFEDIRARLPVIAVVVAAGWVGGSVATGQRGIGLSLAWLVPAVVAVVVAGMATVVPGRSLERGPNVPHPRGPNPPSPPSLGGRGGTPSPTQTLLERVVWSARVPAELAVAAMAVGGFVVALWASDALNHAWAVTPRARLAALAPLALVVVLPMGWRVGAMTVGRANGFGPMGSIGVGAMAFFVATASGRLVTPDEWTIHAAAVGLVEHGRLEVFDGEPYRFTLTGTVRVPGASAGEVSAPSKYPAVGSLVVAPFYAVTRLLGARDPATAAQFPPPERAPLGVTMMVGPATGAALVTATAWLAREAGLRGTSVVVAALATATASLAWPYASTLLNMGLTGAALAGAAAAALRARATTSRNWSAIAGALLGLAASSRYEYLLLGAPIGLLFAYGAVVPSPERRPSPPIPPDRDRPTHPAPPPPPSTTSHGGASLRISMRERGGVVAVLTAAVAWAAVVGPLVFGWNLARTGSALNFGYGDEGLLASLLEKPWYGWYGLLFSPGCGVLVYAPLMLAGLFAMAWLWEDSPPLALCGTATVILAVAYYGSVSSTWCAQTTWGPRYLVAVAPLAMVPIGALWARLTASGSPWRRNPFAWFALGVPWGANIAVNLLAVLVDFGRGWQDHWALGATYQVTTWIPYFSGVTAHVRLLRLWLGGGDASIDVQWLRGVAGTPTVEGTVAMAALMVLAAACVGRAWRLADRD